MKLVDLPRIKWPDDFSKTQWRAFIDAKKAFGLSCKMGSKHPAGAAAVFRNIWGCGLSMQVGNRFYHALEDALRALKKKNADFLDCIIIVVDSLDHFREDYTKDDYNKEGDQLRRRNYLLMQDGLVLLKFFSDLGQLEIIVCAEKENIIIQSSLEEFERALYFEQVSK